MLKGFWNIFRKNSKVNKLTKKNRRRFDEIISDSRFNYLKDIYKKLFDNDTTLTDTEILNAYTKFSDGIQTNSFATAEFELVSVSVLCYFRPNLTENLLRRGLLAIVYSLGDDIDWFTVLQFIEFRILKENVEPYGGLPPEVGQRWLKEILPQQKDTIQKVLEEVIDENRKELEKI